MLPAVHGISSTVGFRLPPQKTRETKWKARSVNCGWLLICGQLAVDEDECQVRHTLQC